MGSIRSQMSHDNGQAKLLNMSYHCAVFSEQFTQYQYVQDIL